MKASYQSGRMTPKRKFILACVNHYIKSMGLENSSRNIILMGNADVDFDIDECPGATSMDGTDDIMLFIDTRLGLQQIMLTVAHEMVHVKQYARGQLQIIRSGRGIKRIWCGREHKGKDYLSFPWEIQAYQQQELLVRRLLQSLGA